jgi:hypothetical protein
MRDNRKDTGFDRFMTATKKILAFPKKDLPLKAASPKKPKATKS